MRLASRINKRVEAPPFSSVVAALARPRTTNGSGVSVVSEDRHDEEELRSYAEILHDAQRLAARLADCGVVGGDPVLIVLPTGFAFIETFFALLLLGAIPTPTYPPVILARAHESIIRLALIARNCEARWCITNRRLSFLLGDLALRVPRLRALLAVEDLDGPATLMPTPAPFDSQLPAMLQYTSGSTGHPKGVLLTHANLVANIFAIGEALRVEPMDVVANWLPMYHDMGLIGTLLFAVYWDLPLVLLSPTTFLADPGSWLRAIHRRRVTLCPAPSFAYQRCVERVSDDEIDGLDLSSWRSAMNGAEWVNIRTIHAFADRFAPRGFAPQAMTPVYGLAESTLAVTMPPLNEPPVFQVIDREQLTHGRIQLRSGPGTLAVAKVGSPMLEHEVAILDDDDDELPEDRVGRVVVRGPSVMGGYYNNPAVTAETIHDGWLETGDLGYHTQGSLFIVGRRKDVVIVRGRKYHAEDIEAVLERVEGVRRGGSVAFSVPCPEAVESEKIVAVCETRAQEGASRERMVAQLGASAREYLGIKIAEFILVKPGTIPRTPSGKRQRSLCRELLLRDRLRSRDADTIRRMWFLVCAATGLALFWARARGRRLLKSREAGRRLPVKHKQGEVLNATAEDKPNGGRY